MRGFISLSDLLTEIIGYIYFVILIIFVALDHTPENLFLNKFLCLSMEKAKSSL